MNETTLNNYKKLLQDFFLKDYIQYFIGISLLILAGIISYALFGNQYDLISFIIWIPFTLIVVLPFGLPFLLPGYFQTNRLFKKNELYKNIKESNEKEKEKNANFIINDSFYYTFILLGYQLIKIYYVFNILFLILFISNEEETREFLISYLGIVFPSDLTFLPNEALIIIYCSLGSLFFMIYMHTKIYQSLIIHSLGIVKINKKNNNRKLFGVKLPELSYSDILLSIILILITNFSIILVVLSNNEFVDDLLKTYNVFLSMMIAYIFLFYITYRVSNKKHKEYVLRILDKL